MHNCVDVPQCSRSGVRVADVAANELKGRVAPGQQKGRDDAVNQRVKDTHAIAAPQQLVDQQRADIAGAAGYENMLPHRRISPSLVRNPYESIVVSVLRGRYSTCG